METPNLNYIRELSGGDINFEESILSVLKKEFPKELLIFKENFEQKRFEEVANNIHKFKHKISILGFKKGLDLASDFEKEIKKGNIELYQDFLVILDKIRVYLEKYNPTKV
ncbi:Hpt domain-containing protein [uncultured Polaribacter sp.]|uniref:Hpt domain-containing protein n=1 Tax=uncultured Polaribacter sp. TaxID=174711 RepID=UPI00262C112A|nr:Hpt domain-containing protein [uncultured Polaribacter sp.]